jgi:hypothetical protein
MTVQAIITHTSTATPSSPFPNAVAGTMANVRVLQGSTATLSCGVVGFPIPSNDFDLGEVDISTVLVSSPFPINITIILY